MSQVFFFPTATMTKRYYIKGPSKNYVRARGGKRVDDFVKYRYVYFEGEGGILQHSYVTASAKLRTQRALHSIFSV